MSSKHRREQLEKRIEGLKKQIERHEDFVQYKEGRLDTTKDYWKKEIGRFQSKKKLTEEKLRKLKER